MSTVIIHDTRPLYDDDPGLDCRAVADGDEDAPVAFAVLAGPKETETNVKVNNTENRHLF